MPRSATDGLNAYSSIGARCRENEKEERSERVAIHARTGCPVQSVKRSS